MKRLTGLILAASLIVTVIPLPGSAATTDAASFAADCNDDGRVDVAGTLKVIGGSGVITVLHCDVFIADDSKLVFRDVRVNANGTLVTWGGLNSTLKVVESKLIASGLIELKTSCCFDEPGVPVNGLTKIVDSTVRGEGVYLSSAVSESGGTLKVRRSKIRANGDDVIVPVGGLVQFTDNDVNAADDFQLAGHDVRVRRNDLRGVADVVSVSGSTACVATANTPAVTCS